MPPINLKLDMTGDSTQTASHLDDIYRKLRDCVEVHPEIAKKMRYKIHGKGKNEEARLEKMLKYDGPGDEAKRFIEENASGWEVDPSKFWSPFIYNDNLKNPQTQIVDLYMNIVDENLLTKMAKQLLCIALENYRRKYVKDQRRFPVDEILSELEQYHPSTNSSSGKERFRSKIEAMHTLGSRYLNMEQNSVSGATMFLGSDLTETHWTKILHKSGNHFDQMMERIMASEVPGLCEKYSKLQEKLIDHCLKQLGALTET